MKSMNRRGLSLLLGLAALLPCALSRADALDQIPDDSFLVVKIGNLQSLNDKLVALAAKCGLDKVEPGFRNPLQQLRDHGGLKNGLDANGDALLAISADFDAPDMPGMVLLPITDYQAFLGNLEVVRKDGEFDVVHFAHETQDMYVANWGKYAAFGPNKAYIKKGTGLKLEPAAATEMQGKDVAMYINMKVASVQLLPKLAAAKQEFIDEMSGPLENLGGRNQKLAAVVHVVMAQYFAGIEAFLRDTQSVVISLNLTNDGMTFSLSSNFAPASYLGNLAAGIPNSADSFTAMLPDAKYIMIAGGNLGGEQLDKILDDALSPIVAELAKSSDDPKAVEQAFVSVRKAIVNIKSRTGGMIAPTADLGKGPLLQTVGVATCIDADKVKDAAREFMEYQGKFLASIRPDKAAWTITPGGKTIDGVSMDVFESKPNNAPAATPEAAQMRRMMQMFFGPGGMSGLFGKVDNVHLIGATGLDDAVVSAAIKAIKDNADPVGARPEIQLVNKNLPKQRFAAFYLSVDVLTNTVADYVRKMNPRIPDFSVPANLPPVGIAVSTEGTSAHLDIFFPTDLAANVTGTVLKALTARRPAPPMPPAPMTLPPGGGAIPGQ